MRIECQLVKKVSQKTGKEYYVYYLPEVEKEIFVEPTELKLLLLLHKEVK